MQYPGAVSFATKVPGHIVPVQLGPGVGVHGPSPRVPVRHAAGDHRRGLSAVAGRGHLWRQRLHVAARGRPGHGVAGAVGRVDPEESGAGRGAACASGPRGRISGLDGLPDHHGSGHQEHDLRRRRHLSGGAARGRERCGCRPCPFRAWRTRSSEYLPHNEEPGSASAVGGALLGGIVGSILGGDQSHGSAQVVRSSHCALTTPN